MIINGYTLQEPPYKGGMALVYHGTNGMFHRAFKMIRPDKAANNPRLCQRFLEEIKIQTKLDHPNIIKILGAYPFDIPGNGPSTVLEMEWLNGMDLQRFIDQFKKSGFSAAEATKIAIRIAQGLEYAHSKGILHLDIKPSNIFRTTDGFIKIIDFGISRVIGANADIVEGAEHLTVTGATGESTFRGTLAYASPEQQVGTKLTFASDVYSFGRTLHFICTGTTEPSAKIADPRLRDIVERCTLYSPAQRFANFTQVLEALTSTPKPKTKNCPKCKKEADASAKFCPNCGSPLDRKPEPEPAVKCPACGRPKGIGRFCTACGHDFQKPNPEPKNLTGFYCKKCGKTNKAYSDKKNFFCNYCGASATNLEPIYS